MRAGVQPEKAVFETAPDLIVRENDPRSSIAPVFAWHRGILRFRPGFNGLFNKTGEGEFAAVHGGRQQPLNAEQHRLLVDHHVVGKDRS